MRKLQRSPTPRDLVLAVIAGDIGEVTALHNAGVSITAPDQYGWLPIHRAAANNRAEIIRSLVRWGSPLEERGTENWSALHLAAVSWSADAAKALLEAGADIHARSVLGRTPLHLAVGPIIDDHRFKIVQVLIDGGADASMVDFNGVSPLAEAREIGNERLLQMLAK